MVVLVSYWQAYWISSVHCCSSSDQRLVATVLEQPASSSSSSSFSFWLDCHRQAAGFPEADLRQTDPLLSASASF